MTTPDHVDRIREQWHRQRPDVDTAPTEVIGRLHRVALALTAELTKVYSAHGVSEAEFDILATLRRLGPPFELQPAELARTTMVTSGGLTKRLDRLEARGLVERGAAAGADRRAKTARLTAAGRALIDAAYTDHMANEARLLALLPEADRPVLERILRTWGAALG